MNDSYEVPLEKIRREIMIKNSRFISTLAPVYSVEEARTFIQAIKSEFSDATHNVPAYLIGYGNSMTAHCNDDGEPSGTAGKPALSVLKGSGMGNIAVVVTRYFGGTKLGTGGLVKAYSEAVKQVINDVPRAIQIEGATFKINVSYNLYNKLLSEFERMKVKIIEKNFTADISLTLFVEDTMIEQFNSVVKNLSAGDITPLFIEKAISLQRVSRTQ